MTGIKLLAAASIAGQALVLVLLVVLGGALWHRRRPSGATAPVVRWAAWIQRTALPLAAFTAFAATFGSLYLSEGAHLEPCLLCWWQRVLMYPQALILGLGAWRRERTASLYSLWLSGIGLGVAIYHIGLQSGLGLLAPCSGGALVSCTTVQIKEFGYVTIPVMSLTGFALLALLAIFSLLRWPTKASAPSAT